MVTIQEVQQREQELNAIENQTRAVANEPIPKRSYGSRVNRRVQEQYVQRKRSAEEVLAQVRQQRKELEGVKEQFGLNEAEQRRQSAIQKALKKGGFALQDPDLTGSDRRNIRKVLTAQKQQQAYNKALTESGLQPVYNKGELIAFKDTKEGRTVPIASVGNEILKSGDYKSRFESIGITVNKQGSVSNEFVPMSLTQSPQTPVPVSRMSQQEIDRRKFGQKVVQGYENADDRTSSVVYKVSGGLKKVTGLSKEQFSNRVAEDFSKATDIFPKTRVQRKVGKELAAGAIEAQITDIQENPLKNVALFAGGRAFGIGLKGTGLIINRAERTVVGKGVNTFLEGISDVRGITLTTKGIAETSLITGGVVYTGISAKEVIGEVIAQPTLREKSGVVSVNIKDAFLFGYGTSKGTQDFNKISDKLKTIYSTEVNPKDIVAPEFFEGQRYPHIRKGQSAGELKKEFYNDILPTESGNKPRSFTASPTIFDKNTKTGRGSSEFPGLYAAPKLSATFLKIQGEKSSLFSFKGLLDVSEPTALRLNLNSIEYAPGVSSSTKQITNSKAKKDFFEKIGGSGRAVIPFIKAEKELIVAFDTPIRQTANRYYFTFEGRRVPIREFEIGDVTKVGSKKGGRKDFILKEVSDIYYSKSGKSSSSIFNPTTSSYRILKSDSSYYSNNVSSSSNILPSSSSTSILKSSMVPTNLIGRSSSRSLPKSTIIPRPFSSSSSFGISYRSSIKQADSSIRYRKNKKTSIEDETSIGYRTFFLRGKQKIYLTGVRTKGSALRFGELQTLKKLKATFGVEKTNIRLNEKDTGYQVSKRAFRDYRIRGKDRIYLNDVFIQKTRGEGGLRGGRLSSRSEVNAIQRARLPKMPNIRI